MYHLQMVSPRKPSALMNATEERQQMIQLSPGFLLIRTIIIINTSSPAAHWDQLEKLCLMIYSVGIIVGVILHEVSHECFCEGE